MVALTNSSITVADTSAVSVLNVFSFAQLRTTIGMDTFFAISARDFRLTNIQISRYQKFVRSARIVIDTLIASNNHLDSTVSLLQGETTELRTAIRECDNMNIEFLNIIAIEKRKSRRQKYIYGFSGGTAGFIGGILLTVILVK